MTAEPIAPVIPSPGRVADMPRVRPTAVRPLPMADPAAALSVPADVVYGTGRIDASGRVTCGVPKVCLACELRRWPGQR